MKRSLCMIRDAEELEFYTADKLREATSSLLGNGTWWRHDSLSVIDQAIKYRRELTCKHLLDHLFLTIAGARFIFLLVG